MRTAALALAAIISTLSSCATDVGYLVTQGGWLYRYSRGTQSVRSLLQSPDTPADLRQFLLRAQEIRKFAFDSIGLRDNGNYTRYRRIPRDHLVDVVSACDAASFAPYLWSYPFLGRLPYRGYYERAEADAEAARLRKEGYDVIVRTVDAFSTLGFLRDPLYSFMQEYSPYDLASLIIHEQTHATLFVKGQPDFNEELATFVGETGALQWLAEKYGTSSAEYRAAVDEQADFKTFTVELKGLSAELKKVYASSLPRAEKLSEKARLIEAFKVRFKAEAAALFRTARFRSAASADLPINNAYLALYDLYTDDIPLMRAFYEQRCGGDLKTFMLALEKMSRAGDIKAEMRATLADGPAH